MKIPTHWAFTLRRDPYEGGNLYIADYIVETKSNCIEMDLASSDSLLAKFFQTFESIEPHDYAKERPIAARALLAGLAAGRDCFSRYPGALTMVPPLGRPFAPESDLGVEAKSGPGYRLWVRQLPQSEQQKSGG